MLPQVNALIWDEARKYLLSFKDVTNDEINRHLNLYQRVVPSSLNDVYKRLLKTLTNRQGVKNWIGDINNLEQFYCGYDSRKIMKKYSNWEKLFLTIQASDFNPPSSMNIHYKRNSWVQYCKGVISGAYFLSRFNSLPEFHEWVQNHIKNDRHVELANKISDNVHGYAFALSCDFLKELGYSDFVKPDTHIIDIFTGIGLVHSRKVEDVFYAVVNFSKSIRKVPYAVDKMFWLIGSGKFYLTRKELIKTDKNMFCSMIRKRLLENGYNLNPIPVPQKDNVKQIKILQDNKKKKEFSKFITLLNEVRRQNKITAKEMRNYKKRWLDYKNMRDEIYNVLLNITENISEN